MSHVVIDTKNLLCPMPVIRTQDAISNLQSGDTLSVLTTDPGSKIDIPTWCRINHHSVLAIEEHDHVITISIKVGEV